ncbi:hypothetical protein ACSBR2_004013 [Camellia fascicularis]
MCAGMEGGILLVCSYGLVNVLIRLHQDSSYVKIVDEICGKFDGFVLGAVCLFFDFPRYKKFKVDSDDDIQNILCLAKSFGINHIEVLIQGSSVGVGVIVSCWIPRTMGEYHGMLAGMGAWMSRWICYQRTVRTNRRRFCRRNGRMVLPMWDNVLMVKQLNSVKFCVNCPWSVHARMLPSSGVLCVKRFDSVHTCGAAVRTSRNPRMGSDLVSTVVADRVRDKPLTRPTNVVFDLKNEYGLDISYRVAWLGVKKARGEVYGDHATSFDQLRWYSNSVMQKNPNSYINLEFDQKTGSFVRYFISFCTCIDGFNHCRPMLFLDGTFLKGRFKGNLLAATAKDANQAHHAYCLLHLQMNLRDRMKYVNASHKIGLMRKLRECAYAPTVTCFNRKLEVLKKANLAVIEDFMKDLHPKHWSNAYFRGQRYGEMCSNAAESFNNWVGEARHLPTTRLVDILRGQIMKQMSERRVKCSKWAGVISLKMEKKLVATYNDSRAWCVSQANDDVYEVHSHPSVLVDVGKQTYSCFQWQINGFPCSYAVVAFRNSGRNIYDAIDSAFCIDTFRATYSGTIYPIPTVGRPLFNPAECLIAPPMAKRPPDQPKWKRIPSKGQVVQRIRCGRCGKVDNHNRKTCKEPL